MLPLQNISPDPKDEYFADGLTEELISTISKVRELSVISSTSAMQYKTRSKPVIEIGRELNAGTILEGSVRKAGNRVQIIPAFTSCWVSHTTLIRDLTTQ